MAAHSSCSSFNQLCIKENTSFYETKHLGVWTHKKVVKVVTFLLLCKWKFSKCHIISSWWAFEKASASFCSSKKELAIVHQLCGQIWAWMNFPRISPLDLTWPARLLPGCTAAENLKILWQEGSLKEKSGSLKTPRLIGNSLRCNQDSRSALLKNESPRCVLTSFKIPRKQNYTFVRPTVKIPWIERSRRKFRGTG